MNRIITAAALIPVVVFTVLWAGQPIFMAVLVTVSFLCFYEYDSIAKAYGFAGLAPLGFIGGFAVLVWPGNAWMPITVTALLALALAMRTEDLAKSLPRAALLVLGVVYIFGAWRTAVFIRSEFNPHLLMFALLVNWVGDTGAYFAGRAFGRHPLAPRISPKKTWEGAIASVIVSAAAGGAYLLKFVSDVTIPDAIALPILANIAGQLGDLAESAIKRGAGVKDSGGILPGHGGFLDRVDSTLFALPVVALYAMWIAQRP